MNTCMEFPKDWHEFLKSYQFIDTKEIYTNGIELIPVFRVEQLIEHLLKEQEAVEPTLIREGRNKNYNDYVCPRCDNVVVYEQNYCSECGVQFLWEGR